MALEGGTNEDRQHQLPVLPCGLRQRENRARTGALAAGREDDDHGMLSDQRLHLTSGFLQCRSGDVRAVARAETSGCSRADQQAFRRRHIRQRELIRIEESRRYRRRQPRGVLRIRFACDLDVTLKQGFHGSKDVAAAAASTQKKNVHLPPACVIAGFNENGRTTHRPSMYGRPLTNGSSLRTLSTRLRSYSTLCL